MEDVMIHAEHLIFNSDELHDPLLSRHIEKHRVNVHLLHVHLHRLSFDPDLKNRARNV
jgi:hypothetical protein